MENKKELQQRYEKQVVLHLLIFQKAMDQYRIWGKRAIDSDVLRGDPQFGAAMRQLIEAMRLCAQQFLALPDHPEGGRDADQLIRNLGAQLDQFVGCLETLLKTADQASREDLISSMTGRLKEMKQSYRQFGAQYNQIFPGRLDQMLQTLHNETEPIFQN